MLTNERLRFRNESTFEEAAPPTDRSRPLEWRRSLNVVTFKTTSPTVEYVYDVNEIDHFHELRFGNESAGAQEQKPPVTPSARRRQRLCAKVSQDEFRDAIYFTKETEKDSGIFELNRTKDDIRLTITDSPPSEHRGPFAAGAYAGTAFRADFEPGEDYLGVEVSLPPQHLAEIIAAAATACAFSAVTSVRAETVFVQGRRAALAMEARRACAFGDASLGCRYRSGNPTAFFRWWRNHGALSKGRRALAVFGAVSFFLTPA